MSDVMLYGVLRMPYEMAMSNEMSRLQFYGRVQEAVRRMEMAEAKLEALGRATPPSPSTARDQAAVLEGVKTAETRMDTGFQPLSEGGPNSPSTAPAAEDELRAAAAEVLKRWDTPLWRQEVGTAALMNRLRAALSSRPAGEVELPPLPELRAIRAGDSFPKVYALAYTADQLRAYGQECARAALASKPASIDAEEVASVIEGALVDDLLPHHSPEWVERARAAVVALRASTSAKEPPCGP